MIALFLSLAACVDWGMKPCTEIGCTGQLTVHVTADGQPVSDFTGTIAGVDVTCGGDGDTAATNYTCGDDGTVTITLGPDQGGEDVEYTLHGSEPVPDTGVFSYDGGGTVTPEWTSSQPNGEDCPPTCWTGEVTIELDVLD